MSKAKRDRTRAVLDGLDLSDLDDATLNHFINAAMDERIRRAVQSADPDTLVREALTEMFSGSGQAAAPQMVAPGVLALAGVVQENSTTRHTCNLYTVLLPDGGPESWAWHDSPTFIHGDGDQIGKFRRSINLHAAVDKMVVVRHSMTKKAGESHERKLATAYELRAGAIDENDPDLPEFSIHLLPHWVASHLPPPSGEEDSRSAASRGR